MLRIDHLTKMFVNAADGIAGGIRDANLDIPTGSFLSLLGPSGCGKTTTLRCVAGLETPDEGIVRIDDKVVFDSAARINVPMNARDIGMVFQSYAIWPHMSVYENVAFPLVVSRQYAREEVRSRVSEALARVDLAGFETRSATRLSGGQQQRVALARAIVRRPKLLLLDEPLSNLDAALREEMRKELKSLQRQLGLTTIYVTHDQEEALALSDTVAVVNKGRIVQIGTPKDIYFRPADLFVAGFVGATNMIEGVATGGGKSGAVSDVRLDSGQVIRAYFSTDAAPGAKLAVSVRPEALRPGPGENALQGVVQTMTFLGSANRCDIACGSAKIHVVLDHRSEVKVGETITLHADPSDVIAFAADAH